MTREVHDGFTKDVLSLLLEAFGDVSREQVVPSETLRTDLLFRSKRVPTDRHLYGAVAAMAEADALFEAYRNPIGDDQIVNCMSKLCLTRLEENREKRRKTRKSGSSDRTGGSQLWSGLHPRLWMITPSCTHRRLEDFGFGTLDGSWPPGFYSLAPAWRCGLVVVNLLPETPETLYLRLLGRGAVQTRAIQALFALPEGHPLRRNLLQIGRRWLTLFQNHYPRAAQDKELFMNLQGSFEEWERSVREEGREEGREEARKEGREEGVLIGRILALREILEVTPAREEVLADLSHEQLEGIYQDLRARLRT